jgi:hypothetical protein
MVVAPRSTAEGTKVQRSGCAAYVAPTNRVHVHIALLFAIHLFYFLAGKRPLEEAVAA